MGFANFLMVSGIFVLLFRGLIDDVRTRTVSNRITFGIIGLSIPLIYINLPNIGFLNFMFLGVFVAAYLWNLGGADLKAVCPLLFIFPNVVFFAGSLAVLGAIHLTIEHYRRKDVPIQLLKVPYFVPLTMTYIVMVVI